MLVYLIYEFVILQFDDDVLVEIRKLIEDFIDVICCYDWFVVWGYEDSNGKVNEYDNKVFLSMEYLIIEVVKIFEFIFFGIKD